MESRMHVKQRSMKCNESLPLFLLQAKTSAVMVMDQRLAGLAKTGFLAVVQTLLFIPLIEPKCKASERKR